MPHAVLLAGVATFALSGSAGAVPVPVSTAGVADAWWRAMFDAGAGAADESGPIADGAARPVDGDARAAARWMWPVGDRSAVVREFEAPPTPYAAGHRGIDIAAAIGAPVRTPDAGTVEFVGTVVDRAVITIRHADGTLSSMEPVVIAGGASDASDVSGGPGSSGEPGSSIRRGARVERGATIGVVGAGGHCDGRCLHLGARVDDAYIDPLPYLELRRRAVLVPLED